MIVFELQLTDGFTAALTPLVEALKRLGDQNEAGKVDDETRAAVNAATEVLRELLFSKRIKDVWRTSESLADGVGVPAESVADSA